MGKHAQVVIGGAGAGKSTFCKTVAEWCSVSKRPVHVVNLDPAAESFGYNVDLGPCTADHWPPLLGPGQQHWSLWPALRCCVSHRRHP